MRGVLILAALVLAGCASNTVPPIPPGGPVPDGHHPGYMPDFKPEQAIIAAVPGQRLTVYVGENIAPYEPALRRAVEVTSAYCARETGYAGAHLDTIRRYSEADLAYYAFAGRCERW
ncbi:hypothetical protein E2L08_01880 [Palleronia sediminis]|uniref:Lipoprotein n=1 Tax=Palleronia sediminis TaxID=2547833 RepID=A0A4V6PPB2_9RHOB|nr:hypothetical protein [Palleronia sediminis]TDL84239.1 hypothetical protein E2L08_01880 [Palleronia sediminis]